jgi:uncharacterized protein
MSTQAKPEYVDEELTEGAVADFLATHPEFFESHPALLRSLRLPHEAGGTISLVERQVSVLRQKDIKLERKLKELIAVARDNDVLAAKLHEFTIQLFAARSLDATVAAIEEAMRAGFNADHSVLVLFGDPEGFSDVRAGRFFRPIERDAAALKPFATFLKGSGPRCGQVRDSQRQFLFHDDAEDIGSVALVPLGRRSPIGFLAIGSVDAERFHPGMSIDFLSRIGDLVAGALKRY